jgi:hypothetical protein
MKLTKPGELRSFAAYPQCSADRDGVESELMPKIALAQLEQMFQGMRAQSGWDTARPLLWGYFFTDPDESKLQQVAEHLARQGYRVVNIYPTDDGSTTFLHVERVEVHTPRSLHARNAEFETLATQFGITSYDGMDVGPLEANTTDA